MSSSENESKKDLPLRKRKSLVWQYFEKLSRARVRCRICRHEQNYQGNTGNILRHLKAKHQVDATQRGQMDPDNLQRLKALNNSTVNMNIKTENQFGELEMEDHLTTYCVKPIIDPYHDTEPLVDFVNTDSIPHQDIEEAYIQVNPPTAKRKSTLEDERIIAETEYFREKAAYFRVQKHVAVLQAKKIKFELDQMDVNCNKSNL